MTACLGQNAPAPSQEQPYSAPEHIESIIEPLELEESSVEESVPESRPEFEIQAEAEPKAEAEARAEKIVSAPESYASTPSPASETASSEAQSEDVLPKKEQVNPISRAKLDGAVIERELLRLMNGERVSVGVETLGEVESMRFAARIRADEALQSFSHTRPDGTPYNTAFDEAGFSYAGKWHGENLASMNFTEGMFDEKEVALEMFTGLKNSEGHYQNMIGSNFYQAGVGVAINLEGGMVGIASAQLFASM